MKNTWIQSAEARNVDDYIDNEDSVLAYYYYINSDKLENHIKAITQATMNELWTPEAFNHSEEYCKYMMLLHRWLPMSITERVMNRINDWNGESGLFKVIMLTILSEIELYNKTYTDIFNEERDVAYFRKSMFSPMVFPNIPT